MAAMTASMTSPQRRHCHPLEQRVEPSASSNLVGTIRPWQRRQFIINPFQDQIVTVHGDSTSVERPIRTDSCASPSKAYSQAIPAHNQRIIDNVWRRKRRRRKIRRARETNKRARDRKVGLAQYVKPVPYSKRARPVNVQHPLEQDGCQSLFFFFCL